MQRGTGRRTTHVSPLGRVPEVFAWGHFLARPLVLWTSTLRTVFVSHFRAVEWNTEDVSRLFFLPASLLALQNSWRDNPYRSALSRGDLHSRCLDNGLRKRSPRFISYIDIPRNALLLTNAPCHQKLTPLQSAWTQSTPPHGAPAHGSASVGFVFFPHSSSPNISTFLSIIFLHTTSLLRLPFPQRTSHWKWGGKYKGSGLWVFQRPQPSTLGH